MATSFEMDHYDPAATLQEMGDAAGLSRERVRQLFPGHSSGRRAVRALDEALDLVRGEVQEGRVQVGLEGEYRSGTAVWCEDCGRKIQGEGREVAPHTSMPCCCRCYQWRDERMSQARYLRRVRPSQNHFSVTCAGTTKLGHPCTAPPVNDSDRCRWHQESS